MIELTTSTKAASAPAARGKMCRPRTILIAVAVLELLAVLWDMLFGRMSILFRDRPELAAPGPIPVRAYVASHLLFALAGLVFASTGRVRHAIFALGALAMMRWLNLMPSVVLNGLKLNDGWEIQWTAAQIFALPLMAACGIALAVRDRRSGLATALISVPTLYNLSGLMVFTVMVLVEGP